MTIRSILFILCLLCFSVPSYAWVIDADFEGGKIGSVAGGVSGISTAFDQTVFTNEKVHGGSLAAKATINAGTDGFGDFGGNWMLPAEDRLYEGDEIWYRTWVYVPQEFSFDCGGCTEGPKFMRIHTVSSKGENAGYWNLHLLTSGITLATSVTQDFYTNHPYPWPDTRKINGQVEKGAWHAYEQYLKFSATPGKGIYRAWYDGKLIFEDKITKTLSGATDYVEKVQLFTYWRGTLDAQPKNTQSLYVDDIMITNEQPDSKDSYGNPFLGVGNATFSAPPKPPTLISGD